MGLLDNILRDGGSPENCDCCQCDINNRSGCAHGKSRLRIPACETCPVKTGALPLDEAA
jgi:hypothetical protein